MDPVSQGILGGSAALSTTRKSHLFTAVLCGILAGMAPDLDALIRSDNDPLLYLEYHRQFTHALIFIPLGAWICAFVFRFTFARRLEFRHIYLYSFVGYATHGLLDSCTTYGTQLLWPFSTTRVAWHSVSIIDPLFTLPLILIVLFGLLKRSHLYGYVALGWALFYLSLGAWQGHRAQSYGEQIAASRGHNPIRLAAKPSFANILVWKIIYETDGRFYVDAVRMGLTTKFYPGHAVEKLDLSRDLPWLETDSQQAKDLERFRWFSNDYLALSGSRKNFVIDMRYSLLPNEVDGLWGIQFEPRKAHGQHVDFVWDRAVTQEKREQLFRMIRGLPLNQTKTQFSKLVDKP